MVVATTVATDAVFVQPASETERAVLIPLAGGERPTVGTVCADFFQPQATSDGLEPQIRELRDIGLYEAAMTARSAVMRFFPMSAAEPGIGHVRLYPLNPGEFDGLQDSNSESAQLGLAVAFMLTRTQSRPRLIMATGAIEMKDAMSTVEIRPVHHVREKLRAFMAHHRSRGASAIPSVIVLPKCDPDKVLIRERHHEAIAEFEAAGATVLTAETLSDVIAALDLKQPWLTPAQRSRQFRLRLLRTALLMTAAIGLLAAAQGIYGRWLDRKLPIEFATTLDREQVVTRFPVQTTSSLPDTSRSQLAPLCEGAPPGVLIGHWLGVGARATNDEVPRTWAVIAVSPGQVKIQREGLSIDPSGNVSGALQVVGEPESMLVGLLAWRRREPDLAATESKLRSALHGISSEEWVARARNVIPQLVPGAVLTVVQTLPEGYPCVRL